ncbi:hypothetical protein [Streptomyces sp. NPDC021562]|uniref:hypothetical protein n=1 Tax=Streptomyces sp. NPDC021562 TaxID=3155121 RepID=UPI001404A654
MKVLIQTAVGALIEPGSLVNADLAVFPNAHVICLLALGDRAFLRRWLIGF